MKKKLVMLVLIVVALVAMSVVAFAAKTQINKSQLPQAVRTSLNTHHGGADIRKITKETKKSGGPVAYVVDMVVGGHRIISVFDAQGNLVGEEVLMPLADMPQAVQVAHRQSAEGKMKIQRAKKVSNGAAAPTYDIVVLDGPEKIEIVYAADGSVVSTKRTPIKT